MNIKAKALAKLMQDLDSHFLKKQLMGDEESEVEMKGEPNEDLENNPEGMMLHEMLEGKKVEKEEHPGLSSNEAEMVAKDHLGESKDYYEEDEAEEEAPEAEEDDEPKGVVLSMSRVAAKSKPKIDFKKTIPSKKGK